MTLNAVLDEDDKRDSREEKDLSMSVSRDSPIRVSVSSAGAGCSTSQWRRESVTIIEGHEPGDEVSSRIF